MQFCYCDTLLMQGGQSALAVQAVQGVGMTFDQFELVAEGLFGGSLTPRIADLNGDGWVEPLGFLNDGAGNLTPSNNYVNLLATYSGRANRDNLLADLNGDGKIDVLANTYAYPSVEGNHFLVFYGNGDGTFQNGITLLPSTGSGFGETLLAADFDNDGDIDVFAPVYTAPNYGFHNFYFVNLGNGHLVETGTASGVGLPGQDIMLRPEGAQAVDINGDGYIDIYAASHIFLNQGGNHFVATDMGQMTSFDEGAQFADLNNDGKLDLVLQTAANGLAIMYGTGTSFGAPVWLWNTTGPTPSADGKDFYEGLNTYDIDGNGYVDIITGSNIGRTDGIGVYFNNGDGTFTYKPLGTNISPTDLLAFGDFNNDRMIDIEARIFFVLDVLQNTRAPSPSSFEITVLDANGNPNQFGRVVRITPDENPNMKMTRVVDGGSGYMSQNQYALLVNSPYTGLHTIEVDIGANHWIAQVAGNADIQAYTDGRFRIVGLSGNNQIVGGGKNDWIDGGGGTDKINAGAGNDHIEASAGNDVVDGGAGNDDLTYNLTGLAGTLALQQAGNTLKVTLDGQAIFNIVEQTNGAGVISGVGAAAGLFGAQTISATEHITFVGSNTLAVAPLVYDPGPSANIDGTFLAETINLKQLLPGASTSKIVVVYARGGDDVILGHDGPSYIDAGNGNDTVKAAAGSDNIDGGKGDDILDGGTGVDIMAGGAGNDMFYVDNLGDAAFEAAGAGNDRVLTSINYTLGAGQSIELFTPTVATATSAMRLTGNELAQTINGNAGNNTLDGKGGNDTLKGLGGNDTFLFDTALNAANNVDRIVDFTHGADRIHLENAVFATLTTPGTLAAKAFFMGAAAHDADDRIIYNPATGALIYDSNGNAAHGAIQFATLAAHLTLTNTDFVVV